MSERMMMPRNKREDLIFAFMCVLFMCNGMLIYNMMLQMLPRGATVWEALTTAWGLMPITCVVCFFLDYFIACPISRKIMSKVGRPWMKPWMGVALFQFFTVCQVAIMESLYGEVMIMITSGNWSALSGPLWLDWVKHIPINFAAALPMMVLLCSPICRFLFRLLIPVGKLEQ